MVAHVCATIVKPDLQMYRRLRMQVCIRRSPAFGLADMAPTAERAAKLRRICALRASLPFISQRALADLLRVAAEDGLPDPCGRSCIREARNEIAHSRTPYGPLHQVVELAEDVELEVCHPAAMLWYTSRLPALAPLLKRARDTAGTGPMHICLYGDEVLPGNQLSHKASRKQWCWYWTVLEFGPTALCHEDRCIKPFSCTMRLIQLAFEISERLVHMCL